MAGKGCALHHWVHDVVFNTSNHLVILIGNDTEYGYALSVNVVRGCMRFYVTESRSLQRYFVVVESHILVNLGPSSTLLELQLAGITQYSASAEGHCSAVLFL
ncbi:hypothetical protein Tco_0771814 [Tanacetum coccineum]|uniref:Uncharacterized protein n=1 Tax=Tanacetum coccineum TaxID=301880 RepID=A0ABQ4ZJW7_9ASTR